ncbi:MAG TPA: hypothetical protein VMM76_28745 [Pirellulaceae bacterium]|nr:hypothetical protein [Pirellulaceae bacterium]
MLRYSLGSLFLVLLYLSFAFAALVNATGVWPQVAVSLTLAILSLFSLGAIFWNERRRVFAIGFSATGWLYFLLVFSSVTGVRPYLLTESATHQLFVTMHGEQVAPSIVYQTVMTANGPRVKTAVYATPVLPPPVPVPAGSNTPAPVYSAPVWQPSLSMRPALSLTNTQFVDSQSFANIGHSLWAVIIAFAGGVTGQLLARGRKQAISVKGEEEPSA